MKIEKLATSALIPYARNAKKHDAAQVSKLAGSIREFGFNNPVLIDSQNGIIAGHGRVIAAQQLGLADVPCIRLGHLTDNQRKAYILADNRLAEVNSGWDEELLKLEIADIDWGDIKGLSVDDFEFGEIDFKEEEPEASEADAEPQIDKAEELRAKWGVEPGQLWELGDHRLLCGDSTKKEDVERVIGAIKPELIFTDPPYGVSVNETNWIPTQKRGPSFNHRLENDDLRGRDLRQFIKATFVAALESCSESVCVYSWSAPLIAGYDMLQGMIDAGIHIQGQLVWVKPSLVLGQADYQWRHEICWYGYRKSKVPHRWLGGRTQTTVWEASRDSDGSHPTMKPVALPATAIPNHLNKKEVVYDPFLGSGTTLIAAEQLGRKCRAIEISPAYVAVALQRWADATGKTPRKL